MTQDWPDHIDEVAPTVLMLGGLFTSPPMYVPTSRRLLRRGAAHVVVADVWLPDWLLCLYRGPGAVVGRSARALLRAAELAASSDHSRGAPLLVIGHSAGGLTARLLTSEAPFAGRRLGGARRIGAIVTLGTPHSVDERKALGRLLAGAATVFADTAVPGPAFSPTTSYLSVRSRFVLGHLAGNARERAAHHLYRGILPNPRVSVMAGDGLVPLRAAGLEGSEILTLDGIVHGQLGGSPWYGSDEAVDVWWPRAVELWREALRARVELETDAIDVRGARGA
ncbi:MAG TPA: hypothetical protein VE817_04900 [Candidatus Acidoferrum sp.]|nr:hypothetical protein [Candidatus Acidoferrum sp.]